MRADSRAALLSRSDLLGRIFRAQAYRELGAARMFDAAEAWAPDDDARLELRAHAREEREHHEGVIALWAAESGETAQALAAIVETRLRERPLPVVASWVDLAMARFLYDRAGFWQLSEYRDCAHEGYRALARAIVADEREHQEVGARNLLALCKGEDARNRARAILPGWLRVALLSFGRPGSEASARAIALGLKRRDPGMVMADFMKEIRPTLEETGLGVPEIAGIEIPAAKC